MIHNHCMVGGELWSASVSVSVSMRECAGVGVSVKMILSVTECVSVGVSVKMILSMRECVGVGVSSCMFEWLRRLCSSR